MVEDQSGGKPLVSSYSDGDLWYYYSDFFHEHGDPRVEGYPLLATPWSVVACCLAYLSFVLYLGPRFMRHRRPFSCLWFIRVYNLIMVLWNLYAFLRANYLLNYGLDTFGCQPIDPNAHDWKSIAMINYGYQFLISRLVEFVDTVCFVLRKKERQISAFHVFHHFSVPIAVWFFVKFAPGGNSAIFPFLNSCIHTIMYSYYFLASFDNAKPYLFWKRYLTQLQIIQFIIMILHSTQPLFMRDCKFPKAFLYINIFFSIIFIYLFTKFYIENYGRQTVRVAKSVSRRLSQQVQSGVRRLSLINHHQHHENTSGISTSPSTSRSPSNSLLGQQQEKSCKLD